MFWERLAGRVFWVGESELTYLVAFGIRWWWWHFDVCFIYRLAMLADCGCGWLWLVLSYVERERRLFGARPWIGAIGEDEMNEYLICINKLVPHIGAFKNKNEKTKLLWNKKWARMNEEKNEWIRMDEWIMLCVVLLKEPSFGLWGKCGRNSFSSEEK